MVESDVFGTVQQGDTRFGMRAWAGKFFSRRMWREASPSSALGKILDLCFGLELYVAVGEFDGVFDVSRSGIACESVRSFSERTL